MFRIVLFDAYYVFPYLTYPRNASIERKRFLSIFWSSTIGCSFSLFIFVKYLRPNHLHPCQHTANNTRARNTSRMANLDWSLIQRLRKYIWL